MSSGRPYRDTSDLFSIPSSLGKRHASDASLDQENAPRSRLPVSTTSLQRRVLELESRERDQSEEIQDLKSTCERLRAERRILLDGETQERQTGETREKEWAAERAQLSQRIHELRAENAKVSGKLYQLEGENAQLSNTHSSLSLHSKSEIGLLNSRVQELEVERDALKGWERRAKGLSIQLEEERRRTDERRQGVEDATADRKVEETVRNELKRQSQYLSTLEKQNASLQNELIDLRQKRKETEANERAAKEIERGLRDEVRILQDQLERARRDMDSLTQTFPSTPDSPAPDVSTLQQRLQALSALHTQASTDLAAKDNENASLHARLTELSINSKNLIAEMTRRAENAERELRWAKEGRDSAERREALARKEVEALSSSRDYGPSMPGGAFGGGSGVDLASRVRVLEKLVDEYKTELERFSRDSRDVEERVTQGAGLVKRSLLDDAEARISQLTADIESLDATISALTSANTTLDAEVNDLMRRVASGEYNPSTERCIELKNNPASKARAIRAKQLEDLTRENQALLDRLAVVDKGSATVEGESGQGLVPRESFDRLQIEKDELERAHAKRLQRLKEIFGTKSKEFLEAVYSLLGWRIKFDESGADIRLTSMYAPKGKMGLTLKFASHEGHFGTMQMTGGMARGLEDVRHFWIQERQSVPGFLAQVTTEMFEKTTIGRAAGYVGFE